MFGSGVSFSVCVLHFPSSSFFSARISDFLPIECTLEHYLCTVEYCSRDLQPLYSEKIYILKMSPTTLFTHLKIILLQYFQQNKLYPNGPLVCVWQKLFLPTYFTIQLIFVIIYGPHCTFWYYSWVTLYYCN